MPAKTGRQYIAGLRDNPAEVWLDGRAAEAGVFFCRLICSTSYLSHLTLSRAGPVSGLGGSAAIMVAKRIPADIKHPPTEEAEDDLSIEYPSSDGEPMAESKSQYVALTDTVSALENHFIERNDVFIGGDMLMYYRMNDNTTRVAPDVFAVFGANGKHLRDSWIVWREGRPPDFVMEMASPSTWRRDVTEKRVIYAEMGVTEYWRFDPSGAFFTPALAGEQLTGGEYLPIPLDTDSDGILRGRSTVLGLDICVRPGLELRLRVPESGQWLRTHRESEEALQAEAIARQAAEEEIRHLREQLRNLQSG